MAEIKSTLDLVLEKTRHLQLSDAEKQQQKMGTIEKRINGLLQKYLDGSLTLDQLKTGCQGLQKDVPPSGGNLLVKAILQRMDLNGDSRVLLDLLNALGDVDPGPLASVLVAYREATASAARARIEELKAALARDHLIAGSAVAPNLDADRQWAAEAARIRTKFQQEFMRQKNRLSGGQ